MEDTKFWRFRQLILDSITFLDNGIHYNSDFAMEKGYSEEEIAIADEFLTNCSFFTADFLDKIKYLRGDSEYKPQIYFVEFAKIIFIIDKDREKSMHIFEEELEKQVFFKQYLGFCHEFLLKKPAA